MLRIPAGQQLEVAKEQLKQEARPLEKPAKAQATSLQQQDPSAAALPEAAPREEAARRDDLPSR